MSDQEQESLSASENHSGHADSISEKERRELRHNSIKLVLTSITVALTLAALGLERYSSLEQRKHEAENEARSRRLTRMTEIGTEFDSLVSNTIEFVLGRETHTLMLRGSLESMKEDLYAIDNRSEQQDSVLHLVESLLPQLLSETGRDYREWATAIQLQSRWEMKKDGFTPDFRNYFGGDAELESAATAEMAWTLINDAINKKRPVTTSQLGSQARKVSRMIRERILATLE